MQEKTMIKILISGICGRMGKGIGLLASQDRDFKIVGALESKESPDIGKDVGDVLAIGNIGVKIVADINKVTSQYDVLIEFTSPEATIEHLARAVKNKASMVIGTTGFTPEGVRTIKDASVRIPILFSPNMSVGANLLFRITEDVASSLNEDYEIEIVEAHHSRKKDAPSGTAKRLGEIVSKVRKKAPAIHSIRIGDIVGDHTVIFAGTGERIELTHRVQSRDAFAKGALAAAKFLSGKTPGLYSMHDVINA